MSSLSSSDATSFSIPPLILFGFVTLFFYFVWIRPQQQQATNNNNNINAVNRQAAQTPIGGRRTNATTTTTTTTTPNATTGSNRQYTSHIPESAIKTLIECSTFPSHVRSDIVFNNNSNKPVIGGANILNDGIVAFRYTKANIQSNNNNTNGNNSVNVSTTTTATNTNITTTDNDAAKLRKDRAKVLSKLLEIPSESSSATTTTTISTSPIPPPIKGSTMIVSIPFSEITCPKAHYVLYLLGTFYNLFVVVVVDSANNNNNGNKPSMVDRHQIESSFRSVDNQVLLSTNVLPNHRILIASTVTGRVAIVRQLNRVEWVIDFDPTVQTQLERFGYKVHVYGKSTATTTTQNNNNNSSSLEVSLLGQEFLS